MTHVQGYAGFTLTEQGPSVSPRATACRWNENNQMTSLHRQRADEGDENAAFRPHTSLITATARSRTVPGGPCGPAGCQTASARDAPIVSKPSNHILATLERMWRQVLEKKNCLAPRVCVYACACVRTLVCVCVCVCVCMYECVSKHGRGIRSAF